MATAADKKVALSRLLEHGVVMVHLDARQPGVRIPEVLGKDIDVKLNFNYQRGKGDLSVTDWGIKETLRFSGTWFAVSVPWCAVYLMTSEGQDPEYFPDDFPEELIERVMVKLQQEGHSLEELEERRPRSIWADRTPAAPKAAPPPSPDQEPADEGDPKPAIRRGHLRLIK